MTATPFTIRVPQEKLDTVTSALWLCSGSGQEQPAKVRIDLPTGFAAFPGKIIPPAPHRVAELDFNITRWSVMKRGGHFAAWEEPAAFASGLPYSPCIAKTESLKRG